MRQVGRCDTPQVGVKRAIWLDWRSFVFPKLAPDTHIYVGHETCEHLLPTPTQAFRFLNGIDHDQGRGLTLVTPFLTQDGLGRARTLIKKLLCYSEKLEIVCNDWGLLWDLLSEGVGRVAVGRILAGQSLDPRIDGMLDRASRKAGGDSSARMVHHMDGTRCLLQYRAPSAELAEHFRSVSIDREGLGEFLAARGIARCEVSYPKQGLRTYGRQWAYTLHRPWVPLTVMRCPTSSPSAGEKARHCPCIPGEEIWRAPGFPLPLVRRDNVLGYRELSLPPEAALTSLGIDRIVEPFSQENARDEAKGHGTLRLL
jgi:hypothetical protein